MLESFRTVFLNCFFSQDSNARTVLVILEYSEQQKNYGGPQKSFSFYGLYLSMSAILKIKMDAFTAAAISHNCLIGF